MSIRKLVEMIQAKQLEVLDDGDATAENSVVICCKLMNAQPIPSLFSDNEIGLCAFYAVEIVYRPHATGEKICSDCGAKFLEEHRLTPVVSEETAKEMKTYFRQRRN